VIDKTIKRHTVGFWPLTALALSPIGTRETGITAKVFRDVVADLDAAEMPDDTVITYNDGKYGRAGFELRQETLIAREAPDTPDTQNS